MIDEKHQLYGVQMKESRVKPGRAQLKRLSTVNKVETGNYYFGLTVPVYLTLLSSYETCLF